MLAAGAPKLNALVLAVVAADAPPKLNRAVAAAGAGAAVAEAPKAKAEDDAGPPKEKGAAGLPKGSEAAGLAGPPKENREDVAAAGAGSEAVSSGGSARKLNEGFFGGMPPAPARVSSAASADGAPPPKAEAALVPLVEADAKVKGAGALAAGSGARGAEGPEGKLKVTVLAAGSTEASLTPEPFGAEKAPKLGGGTPARKGCVKLDAEAGRSRCTCMELMCQKLGGSFACREGWGASAVGREMHLGR